MITDVMRYFILALVFLCAVTIILYVIDNSKGK
jgi:preprotein translocase subunit SecE